MRRFTAGTKTFEKDFAAYLSEKREVEEDVRASVTAIIGAVRKQGDAALLEYTQKFDRLTLTPKTLRVTDKEITAAAKQCPREVTAALQFAAKRITAFYKKHLPKSTRYKDAEGVALGARWNAVDAAGIYVPGGLASYPSSVLMNALPAKVAGVKRIVMAVPAPEGKLNPAVLAAARIAGVDEIYRMGGAQAVAALAYGTESIRPVDVIAGPGNQYVAEAKRQVFGHVGIDMIAGPSEILVVADKDNDPAWIAADLLSQAEHDTSARSVLITDNAAFAGKVEKEITHVLQTLPRAAIASKSILEHGAVIVVKNLAKDAPALVDAIAPEHLELAVAKPEALAAKIRHAGAIFLGKWTPEAIGDYVAGPSHVLPTAATARFSSGLSVHHFMKKTSLIGCSQASLKKLGKAAALLAGAEGLDAHKLSVEIRMEGAKSRRR